MDEQKKYQIIKGLTDHPGSSKERAALTLGCSLRHINRMLAGYKESGKEYFVHGNRGRKPANTIPDETRRSVIDLYREKYYDANFTHYTELLGKQEEVSLSPLPLFQTFWKWNTYFRLKLPALSKSVSKST